MKKVIFLFALMMVQAHSLYSQPFNQAARDSIRKLTEQDHQRMMDLLGIVSLRPGVNGMDPNAPDAANYDETKANPYPVLPEPLGSPRPVFVSSGETGDAWVDARGMFMAAVAAGPVYKLLGKKDLGTNVFPAAGTTLTDGEIAFRQHTGGHTPGPNWPVFLEYANRYFKTNKPTK